MAITRWMSWEGGVDLAAGTRPDLAVPNALVRVARVAHTPLGSAPAGLLVWQPDPHGHPAVAGFVCPDPAIGAWFGPNLFRGTPFEDAPALPAVIEIDVRLPDAVAAKVTVGGHVFEVTLTDLGPAGAVNRPPGLMPFAQQGVEARAGSASLKVDGQAIAIHVPALGMSGAPGACWSPVGLYAR
ncbi:MAG TPA: hypothetical protein VF950_08755 [Planctomycetota bacterium]